MLEARIVREAQNTDRPLLILFQSYTKHLTSLLYTSSFCPHLKGNIICVIQCLRYKKFCL